MESILFKKVELWLVLLLLVLLAVLGILFGALVRNHAMGYDKFGVAGDFALAVAEIPSVLRTIAKEDDAMQAQPYAVLDGKSGWQIQPGTKSISEMLLLSRYDGDRGRHVIELMDLGSGKVAYTWAPDAEELLKGVPWDSENIPFERWNAHGFRYIHPYLDDAGGILLKNHRSPLVKLNACGELEWRQTGSVFHHTTEPAPDGTFWVPGRADPPRTKGAPPEFKDDMLTKISAQGEILYEKLVSDIFFENGLAPTVFATGTYSVDPFHLNDIQPVTADGPFWKAGDLFLNLRHQSMVMLYRPSSGKIIWSKRGPWMAEHDVDILDDHRIAVFNNNAMRMATEGNGQVQGVNEIAVYDFQTDTVSRPWADVFERERIATASEGLFQFASGGQLLVEEENHGRLLVFAADGSLLAEFVNRGSDGNTYSMGWSRLMDRTSAEKALAALQNADCG